jgi:hypothetical protein
MSDAWEGYKQQEGLPEQLPKPARQQSWVALFYSLQRSVANLVVAELPAEHQTRHFEDCWLLEVELSPAPRRSRMTWETAVGQGRLAVMEAMVQPMEPSQPSQGDRWQGWSWYR